MNYGFKSIVIEPFNGYLDFQGPLNPENASGSITLKGDIHLDLTKIVKVKSATIKFKGYSRVCHQNTIDSVDISTPILPKLKTQIFSSTTTLGPGQITLPWEMEILNVYPASVMIKRASINYKIELSISLGLKRVVSSSYPIVIRRHLLPCKEVAPLIPTKMYSKTISTKFHYEITAPRIVCIAQTCIPFHIKLLSIGSQKRVLNIRTQILQIELYRCNALPKSEANMTRFKTQLMKPKKPQPSGKKGELNKYAKYTKRTTPAIIHTLDETEPLSSNQPILLRHPLDEYLNLGLESPLASIYHQLEITFQFGAKFEDIRAKIPILISSTTTIDTQTNNNHQPPPMPLYPYEKLSLPEPLFVMDETRLEQNGTASTIKALAPSSTKSVDVTGSDDHHDMDSMEFNHSEGSTATPTTSPHPLRKKQSSRLNVDSAVSMNNNSSSSSSNATTSTATITNSTTLSQQDIKRGGTRSTANLCISLGSHDVDDEDHKNYNSNHNKKNNASINNNHCSIENNNINNNNNNNNNNNKMNNDIDNMKNNIDDDMDITNFLTNSLPIPPVKHRRPSHPSTSLSSSTNDKSSSPTLNNQSSQQQHQRFLTVDNIESSNGMWPRPPDSSVPSQWRRRSASQSFIIDNSQLSQHQKRLHNTRIHTQSQSNLFSAANTNHHHHHNMKYQSTSSPKNKSRPIQQRANSPSDCGTSSSSFNESNTYDNDDDYDDDSYTNGSDQSSYVAPSLISGASYTESSSYELQSRPTSPVYPNAPGLPPAISLRPQDANPIALLEESFVPSPGSLVSTPVVSNHNLGSSSSPSNHRSSHHHLNHHHNRGSVQYNHNVWYDSNTNVGSPFSSDMMSIISNAQSSVLDTDEEMLRLIQQMGIQHQQSLEQKRSLEQHYTYAELPPIPRPSNNNHSSTSQASRPTTVYYVEDSDGEDIEHTSMYDSDDQSLAITNTTNNDNANDHEKDLFIPPIAGSPLPPLPREMMTPEKESVCICPKHGVAVHK